MRRRRPVRKFIGRFWLGSKEPKHKPSHSKIYIFESRKFVILIIFLIFLPVMSIEVDE